MTAGGRAPDIWGDTFLSLNLSCSVIKKEKELSERETHGYNVLFVFLLRKRKEKTYRLEYKRVPRSCEGDPAPILAPPMDPAALFNPFEGPKGDLTAVDDEGSLGELRPVDEPDMG